MLTAEQRLELLTVRYRCMPKELEAVNAALATIDQQAEELREARTIAADCRHNWSLAQGTMEAQAAELALLREDRKALREAIPAMERMAEELALLRRVVGGFAPVAMIMEPDDEAYWLDADGLAALREWRERHGGQAK